MHLGGRRSLQRHLGCASRDLSVHTAALGAASKSLQLLCRADEATLKCYRAQVLAAAMLVQAMRQRRAACSRIEASNQVSRAPWLSSVQKGGFPRIADSPITHLTYCHGLALAGH
jgi:hypothetical protein